MKYVIYLAISLMLPLNLSANLLENGDFELWQRGWVMNPRIRITSESDNHVLNARLDKHDLLEAAHPLWLPRGARELRISFDMLVHENFRARTGSKGAVATVRVLFGDTLTGTEIRLERNDHKEVWIRKELVIIDDFNTWDQNSYLSITFGRATGVVWIDNIVVLAY